MPALYWLRVSCTASLARLDRLVLHRVLLLEDAQRRELVLDLLERGEHRLAIVGDRGVVGRARLGGPAPARAPKSSSVSLAVPPNDQTLLGALTRLRGHVAAAKP